MSDKPVRPSHSDDDTESDSDGEGQTYDLQGTPVVIPYSDSDTDIEDTLHNLPSSLLPQQPASHIRKSSVVTIGNKIHKLKCLPLYNFLVEKNFIHVPVAISEQMGCYGLENLISPVEIPDFHVNQDNSFVAVIEDYKGRRKDRSTVYVHPELFFNLFPFPINDIDVDHMINAEVLDDL